MQVTSADRVMFPVAGITKGEMVGYYASVADLIYPFLADRPLTLERYPRGIEAKGFMQKNAADHFPASIGRYEVQKNDGGMTTYPVVTEPDHVAYLANQGTVSFHVWTSRLPNVDQSDYLVMDLDPTEGDIEGVRSVTRDIGEALDSFGVASLPVATGSKGFHVWAPIEPLAWDRVSLCARAIAGLVSLANASATTEFLKRERQDRVFVDWLRNHPGASVVSPFSIRPRPTAPISMPITWDELDSTEPDSWTIRDIEQRRADLPTWPSPTALPHDEIEAVARKANIDLDSPFDRFGRDR